MLEVAAAFPGYQPVIAGAPGIERAYYARYTSRYLVKIVFNKTYPLLYHSSVALVTSGTATLEASLFRVPQVVCYYVKIGKIAGFVFRHFFHTPYISLVNLIAGREIVRELFADRFSYPAIYTELKHILSDESYRKQLLDGYDEVIHILGKPGASQRTARLIFKYLNN
jgi:lipid-A-disaccharide synthase